MGIFDFMKDSGKDPGENAADGEAMGRALFSAVRSSGARVRDLSVDFNDGTAHIHGEAETQADKEKAVLAAGNHRGVAHVDDSDLRVVSAAADADTSSEFYTVKSGDTLSGIAQAQYGDAGEHMRIFEANQPMLEDPDEIYPGQVLRLPGK